MNLFLQTLRKLARQMVALEVSNKLGGASEVPWFLLLLLTQSTFLHNESTRARTRQRIVHAEKGNDRRKNTKDSKENELPYLM